MIDEQSDEQKTGKQLVNVFDLIYHGQMEVMFAVQYPHPSPRVFFLAVCMYKEECKVAYKDKPARRASQAIVKVP